MLLKNGGEDEECHHVCCRYISYTSRFEAAIPLFCLHVDSGYATVIAFYAPPPPTLSSGPKADSGLSR